MTYADSIMKIQIGTTQFAALRQHAAEGDPDALLSYVYFCAWQGIRSDKFIPAKKKAAVFRALVEANMIQAELIPAGVN